MSKKQYLNFPVSAIPDIIRGSKQTLYELISYAVVSYAEAKDVTLDAAGNHLGVNVVDSAGTKRKHDAFIQQYGGCRVMTSIDTHTAFDFRDNSKSPFDNLLLGAHLACRSIVGAHPYTRTTKAMILSRMSGSGRALTAPQSKYTQEVKKLDGPNARRQWEKVFTTMQAIYGLKVYVPKGGRGYYMSYTLDPVDLATSVERAIACKRARKNGRLSNDQLREIALKKIADEMRTP